MDLPPIPFVEFPKIPRLSREIIITEKIDGTNAQIYIDDTGTNIYAGSRTRWITPQQDNFGFAAWVEKNAAELMKLGPGSHFGEWWGAGIQRKYGLTEKRFSLFNVSRWGPGSGRPLCCGLVPLLYQGPFDEGVIQASLLDLATRGSQAAPGFMNPEGIVVYHVAARRMFKKTLERDEEPKSAPRK